MRWHGNTVVQVTYKDSAGTVGTEPLFRDREVQLQVVETGRSWSFSADARLFRLVSEAQRIRMAHRFEPYPAVSSSLIDPLPHQITAGLRAEAIERQVVSRQGSRIYCSARLSEFTRHWESARGYCSASRAEQAKNRPCSASRFKDQARFA